MPQPQGTLGHRIVTLATTGLTARCLPVELEGVISIHLSYPVPFSGGVGEDLLQRLATGLLDRGTKRLTREAFSEALEDTGAELSFSSDTGWVRARLRCLVRDTETLVPLLAECMRSPRFEPDECELVRQQLISGLMRSRSNTGVRSSRALRRRLYKAGHPHHVERVEDDLAYLGSVTPEKIRACWERTLQPSAVQVAVVGDISESACRDMLETHLGDFADNALPVSDHVTGVQEPGGREHIHIADRTNLDVRMGHAVGMLRNHSQFEALYAGLFILGGNFSGRLMNTVRDRDGLTYGVRSSLSGGDVHWNGTWDTSISLSSENLERGIQRTLEEMTRFVEEGVTSAEAETVGLTLAGNYLVHLGTTGGMASTIRRHMERGLAATEVDEYPERMRALSATDINAAIKTWLSPSALWICSAGTRQ